MRIVAGSWKMDPAGVDGILTSVGTEQQGLVAALGEGEFEAIFTGTGEAGGLIAKIPKALQALMENRKLNLQAVTNRAAAGTNGVANAVVSYNQGQETMTGEFQWQMVASASSGDFSYFEVNGYKNGLQEYL